MANITSIKDIIHFFALALTIIDVLFQMFDLENVGKGREVANNTRNDTIRLRKLTSIKVIAYIYARAVIVLTFRMFYIEKLVNVTEYNNCCSIQILLPIHYR